MRTNDPDWQKPTGEDGVSRELLEVRSALLRLPRTACPVGFEFRLQRRLEGVTLDKPSTSGLRGWTLAWAGVGLGVAASVLVAVVAFDFQFKLPVPGTAAVATAPAAVTPGTITPPAQVASDPVPTPAQTTDMKADQMAASHQQRNEAVKDSSTPRNPTALPENLYQQVNGSGGK
jgi:hypothetical protein